MARKLNWDKIKDEYMPSKVCAECRCMMEYQAFTATEWNRSNSEGRMIGNCIMCLADKKNEPIRHYNVQSVRVGILKVTLQRTSVIGVQQVIACVSSALRKENVKYVDVKRR